MTRRNFLECTAVAAVTSPAPGKTILEQARLGERLEGVNVVDMHGHFLETEPGRIWPRGLDPLFHDMDRCGWPDCSQPFCGHRRGDRR